MDSTENSRCGRKASGTFYWSAWFLHMEWTGKYVAPLNLQLVLSKNSPFPDQGSPSAGAVPLKSRPSSSVRNTVPATERPLLYARHPYLPLQAQGSAARILEACSAPSLPSAPFLNHPIHHCYTRQRPPHSGEQERTNLTSPLTT